MMYAWATQWIINRLRAQRPPNTSSEYRKVKLSTLCNKLSLNLNNLIY